QWLSRDGECCGGPCGRDGRPVCLPDLRHRPLTNRECERTEPVLALDAAAGRPGHVRELRHCAAGWPLPAPRLGYRTGERSVAAGLACADYQLSRRLARAARSATETLQSGRPTQPLLGARLR